MWEGPMWECQLWYGWMWVGQVIKKKIRRLNVEYD